MKSEFKSGDTVIFNDKLFLIKQGLASTIQPKKQEKVQFEYLAYRLRNNEISTKKVYILKESEIRKAILPPDSTREIAKSVNLFEHKRNQEEFQKGDIVWHEGRLYCIDNINLKIKKLVPDSMFCETFVDTNYMAYPVCYDSHTSSYVIKKEGRTSICGSESDWIGASGDFFNCVRDLPLRSDSGKEANVKLSVDECSHTKDSSKKQSTLKEQESVEFTKGQFVRVKDQEGVYRILRVESSSCWLDKLIIKGNSISAEVVPVRKEYEELEWLSPYEESLLRREVEPRAMSTIEQELRLEEMNNRFAKSMTYDEKSFGDLIREVESFDKKEVAKVDSFLKRLFDRIREFIVSVFSDDSKESIAPPVEEAITFESLVRKLRYSIEDNQHNDRLIGLYNLLRNVISAQKKESIRVRLGETILKTIEMVYVNSQKDKVNALLDDMIVYVMSIEDVDLGKDIELEHDYVKKLIRDSKAVDKVTSVDEIIKSDGYEVSAIECDKE